MYARRSLSFVKCFPKIVTRAANPGSISQPLKPCLRGQQQRFALSQHSFLQTPWRPSCLGGEDVRAEFVA